MCNLYRMSKSRSEVADFFREVVPGLAVPAAGNAPEEVYPGYPALVLASGELQQMVWGFPLQMKGAKGQLLNPKPVNNARSDKLSTSFWSSSFQTRRCLIPATGWAEAEGPKGAMTRTWLAPTDAPLFALAGIWRESAEWGPAYAMVMTEACVAMPGAHTRMPVVLVPADWEKWLAGLREDALALCCPWPGDLVLARTDQPWVSRR